MIVKGAEYVVLLKVALMFAIVWFKTGTVPTVNVPVELPAGIKTLLGAGALALLDPTLTTTPPTGADPLSVMVPVEGEPPMTVDGVSTSPVI